MADVINEDLLQKITDRINALYADKEVSPYERPEFLARVKELKDQGRNEYDAMIIADTELHCHFSAPSDEPLH